LGYKIKNNLMVEACDRQEEVKKCLLVFRRRTSDKDDMQVLGVDVRILFLFPEI